ncbi:hypothetical protein [Ruminococcus sp. 5_1_39BFAA]|uniref:hypothetical protein n=1 Tax=Ruminococcus sp. 5_1_39BFAA TaxID=457412 RepID=UPI00356235A7
MALILLVKVQPRVFAAECSEPQVGISNGTDEGSGAAKMCFTKKNDFAAPLFWVLGAIILGILIFALSHSGLECKIKKKEESLLWKKESFLKR